jgi:hypothetical protein
MHSKKRHELSQEIGSFDSSFSACLCALCGHLISLHDAVLGAPYCVNASKGAIH